MDEGTFRDLVDWLAEHAGASVYIESGLRDPTADADDTYYLPIAMHAVLAAPDIGENLDHERGIVYVKLDPADRERNRLYFDKEHVSEVELGPGVVRVWFRDRMYVALAAS